MHLVDLGSGEGSLVRAAVRQGGLGRATGYEINPALLALARLRSLASPHEAFRWRSLWAADLARCDVAIVHGIPPIMGRLGEKLRAEMPAHALVISNSYELPGLGEPLLAEHVRTSPLSPDASGPIYVYRARAPGGAP